MAATVVQIYLYDPDTKTESLMYQSDDPSQGELLSPIVKLGTNKAGGLDFTMLPGHEQCNNLKKLRSIVRVVRNGKTMFRGRISDIKEDIYGQKNVSVEGDLAILSDTYISPNTFVEIQKDEDTKKWVKVKMYKDDAEPKMSVESFLRSLIDSHNVELGWDENESNKTYVEKWFEVGTVSAKKKSTVDTFGISSFNDTNSVINSSILAVYGGIIRTRYNSTTKRALIDWIEEYSDSQEHEIKFGVNLLELDRENPNDNIWTVLVPYGENNLTIESSNLTHQGKIYIENASAVEKYGWIVHHRKFEGVKDATELYTKAKAYLDLHAQVYADSFVVKAVDLSVFDPSKDAIDIGDKVKVVYNNNGDSETMYCLELEYDVQNPENSRYTIGTVLPPDSDKIIDAPSPKKALLRSNGSRSTGIGSGAAVKVDPSGYRSKAPLSAKFSGSTSNLSKSVLHLSNEIDGIKRDLDAAAHNINVNAENIAVNAKDISVNAENIALSARNITLAAEKVNLQAQELNATFTNKFSDLKTTIQATAEGLRTEVSNAAGQYSQIVQNVNKISAAVFDENNHSKIELLSDRITSEVTRIDGAISRVTQTANGLMSEVYILDENGEYVIDEDGNRVSKYSQIVQNVNKISAAVFDENNHSKIELLSDRINSEVFDANGNSKITQLSGQIQMKVTADDVVSMLTLTDTDFTINAEHINLNGYATIEDLNTTRANITDLTSGRTTASTLKTASLQSDYIYIPVGGKLQVRDMFAEWAKLSMADVVSERYVLAGDSGNGIDLTHYHAVTVDASTGNLTIGAPQSTQPDPFSIADTQYFKNAIAQARAEGGGGIKYTSKSSTISIDSSSSVKTINLYTMMVASQVVGSVAKVDAYTGVVGSMTSSNYADDYISHSSTTISASTGITTNVNASNKITGLTANAVVADSNGNTIATSSTTKSLADLGLEPKVTMTVHDDAQAQTISVIAYAGLGTVSAQNYYAKTTRSIQKGASPTSSYGLDKTTTDIVLKEGSTITSYPIKATLNVVENSGQYVVTALAGVGTDELTPSTAMNSVATVLSKATGTSQITTIAFGEASLASGNAFVYNIPVTASGNNLDPLTTTISFSAREAWENGRSSGGTVQSKGISYTNRNATIGLSSSSTIDSLTLAQSYSVASMPSDATMASVKTYTGISGNVNSSNYLVQGGVDLKVDISSLTYDSTTGKASATAVLKYNNTSYASKTSSIDIPSGGGSSSSYYLAIQSNKIVLKAGSGVTEYPIKATVNVLESSNSYTVVAYAGVGTAPLTATTYMDMDYTEIPKPTSGNLGLGIDGTSIVLREGSSVTECPISTGLRYVKEDNTYKITAYAGVLSPSNPVGPDNYMVREYLNLPVTTTSDPATIRKITSGEPIYNQSVSTFVIPVTASGTNVNSFSGHAFAVAELRTSPLSIVYDASSHKYTVTSVSGIYGSDNQLYVSETTTSISSDRAYTDGVSVGRASGATKGMKLTTDYYEEDNVYYGRVSLDSSSSTNTVDLNADITYAAAYNNQQYNIRANVIANGTVVGHTTVTTDRSVYNQGYADGRSSASFSGGMTFTKDFSVSDDEQSTIGRISIDTNSTVRLGNVTAVINFTKPNNGKSYWAKASVFINNQYICQANMQTDNSVYNAGYDAGYNKGYSDGWVKGFQDAFNNMY